MKVLQEKTKVVPVTVDVLCDRCGESLKGHIGNINGLHLIGGGSYDSTHFPDMYSFQADVCEPCAADWFKTFKRNPLDLGPHEYTYAEGANLDEKEEPRTDTPG